MEGEMLLGRRGDCTYMGGGIHTETANQVQILVKAVCISL